MCFREPVTVSFVGPSVVGLGLLQMLQPAGVHVVADAGPGSVVLVVLDPALTTPAASGRAVADLVAAQRRVVALLSSTGDGRFLEAIVTAGASGLLLLDVTAEAIADSVHAALAGGCTIDPRLTRQLLEALRPEAAPLQLTEREAAVLRLVSLGLLNKQIARRLGISEPTVKTHLTRVFQRIGVRTRTEAAAWFQAHASEESLATAAG